MSDEFDPSKHTILVVDDERELAEIISEELTDFGYSTLIAYGGLPALEMIKNNDISLVVSDVIMSNGSGTNLLIDMQKSSSKIPIFFMMTGFIDYTEDELIILGAKCLIRKPLDCDELHAAITKQLSGK